MFEILWLAVVQQVTRAALPCRDGDGRGVGMALPDLHREPEATALARLALDADGTAHERRQLF